MGLWANYVATKLSFKLTSSSSKAKFVGQLCSDETVRVAKQFKPKHSFVGQLCSDETLWFVLFFALPALQSTRIFICQAPQLTEMFYDIIAYLHLGHP